MKERLKKELEVFLFIVVLVTLTYLSFLFLNIVKQPSITGMVVYETETNYKNYTFINSSLYSFNDSLINLSDGIRLKASYTYYNITNEINEIITLVNITYPDSAVIDTLDFSPFNLQSWDELTKNEVLNDQQIDYYYSIDSGENWTLINFNSPSFNLSSVNSDKILFRINLVSDTTETPFVNYLTLGYLTNISCTEDWQCTDWSECYENNTQIRSCTDNNVCGSEDELETQACTYTPGCTTNWTALYQDCLINDTQLMYYNDTSKCDNMITIPSDNNTYVDCDYCLPNFTCSSYGNCTDSEQLCLAVNDENDCYSLTNLTSDNYTEDYTELTTSCNETSETSQSSEGGEGAAAAGESAGSGSAETKLEAECNYDVSINLPEIISFTEENSFETDIKNTGCKIDKLSLSLSDELKKIIRLDNYEINNLEEDKTTLLNLSTDPILTRTNPVFGMAAKVVQKQTKNITGFLIIKGIAENENKIDKSISIQAQVILFDKIKLEKKSPIFIMVILGLLIATVIVYLTTKYNFKFKIQK